VLTKDLHFDSDVLDTIRSKTHWSDDGLSVTIDMLDRKLYMRVNKALEEMGGRWDTRRGCHVFKTDPRSQIEGFLESGTITVELDGFFETPKQIVETMIDMAGGVLYGTILEPSAGMGAIATGILDRIGDEYASLYMIEKNHERCEFLTNNFKTSLQRSVFVIESDFKDVMLPGMFDFILMNPPFEQGQDIDHVEHAYQFLKPGGILVSVMSEGVFFRSDKKAVNFRVWLERAGGVAHQLPPGSFKESGTGANSRVVKIVHG